MSATLFASFIDWAGSAVMLSRLFCRVVAHVTSLVVMKVAFLSISSGRLASNSISMHLAASLELSAIVSSLLTR